MEDKVIEGVEVRRMVRLGVSLLFIWLLKLERVIIEIGEW